jgi:Pyruvate/2-oxoacid:ferredoxin oxidoreductase gamma subunit
VEREVIATGIGGQGIQLAAEILARAATAEGREVLMFGSYGGMMRGGNTDANLVFADSPISAPPVPPLTWAALLMHHEHAAPVLAKLRSDSVVFVNVSVVDTSKLDGVTVGEVSVIEVPATDLAVGVGNIITASLVMVGALAAATGIVSLGSLTSAVEIALPSYRKQHVELNVRALAAGFQAVPTGSHPAWSAGDGTIHDRAEHPHIVGSTVGGR